MATLALVGLAGCSAAVAPWVEGRAALVVAPAACAGASGSTPGDRLSWISFASPGAATPAEWCESVGPALLPRPALAANDTVGSLVVATWNVRVGAGDVERFVGDLRSGALTGRVETDLVLLLQEAHRAGPDVPYSTARLTSRIEITGPSGERADIAEIARRLDLHAFYVPSMPNGPSRADGPPAEDRGNAVLSTLPLDQLAAIELPFEVQRRVAAAATVRGIRPDGREWVLRVASGHLDTRSRPSRLFDSFGSGRTRQAVALERSLAGDAVVLGADLNTWSASFLEQAVDLLYERFPDTPTLEGPTFVAAGILPRRLDHLLFRLPEQFAAVDVRRADDRYGSDHYPLVAVVRFE